MHTNHTTLLIIATLATAANATLPIPANPDLQWFKGNLHTHTFWSDGNDFPDMIAEWYRDHDYNFLALSDHNILSQGQKWMNITDIDRRSGGDAFGKYLDRFGESWVETRGSRDDGTLEVRLKPLDEYRTLVENRGQFLMIQGEEITGSFQRRPIHINSTNLGVLIPPQAGDTAEEVIRNVLQAVEAHAEESGREILTHLNHPNFGWGVTAEDFAAVLEERFFEVFNGHTSVRNDGDANHASTEKMWDIINTIRIAELNAPPMFGIATDDSHSYHGHSDVSVPGRGWVMVQARHLSPESIIRAMKAGDFYASTGVSLDAVHFDEDNGSLTIHIATEERVEYTTQFIGTMQGVDLTGEPVLDDEGNPIIATRRYSDDVGRVLSEVKGTPAIYNFTGDELYVRAIITSTAPTDKPFAENRFKRAWVQPYMPAAADD